MSDTTDHEVFRPRALKVALKLCYSSSWVQSPEDLARDLVQVALAKLQELEAREPGSVGNPQGFLRTKITRDFITFVRAAKRQADLRKKYGDVLEPTSSGTGARLHEDDEAEAVRCLAPFLLITRHKGWSGGRAKVKFKQVFLFQLRLAVLEAAARRCPEYEPGLLLRVAKQTAPWPRRDRLEGFKPGHPTLEDTWRLLVARYPDDAKVTEATGVVGIVGELTDVGVTPLTKPQWSKWITRSREKAKTLVPERVWSECFEPLCPTRQPPTKKIGGDA